MTAEQVNSGSFFFTLAAGEGAEWGAETGRDLSSTFIDSHNRDGANVKKSIQASLRAWSSSLKK